MYKKNGSKIIAPRKQFLVITDNKIPEGYTEEKKFNRRCEDEKLIFNNTDMRVQEYLDERENPFYPEIGQPVKCYTKKR